MIPPLNNPYFLLRSFFLMKVKSKTPKKSTIKVKKES